MGALEQDPLRSPLPFLSPWQRHNGHTLASTAMSTSTTCDDCHQWHDVSRHCAERLQRYIREEKERQDVADEAAQQAQADWERSRGFARDIGEAVRRADALARLEKTLRLMDLGQTPR